MKDLDKTKKWVALFALVMSGYSASAQSFAFYRNNELLPNGAEFTVTKCDSINYGTVDQPFYQLLMESGISLKMLTTSTIDATMTQSVLSEPAYGALSFCFGACLSTNKTVSLNTQVDENTYIHLAYEPEMEKYTTAKVQYKVVNKAKITDEAHFTINYQYAKSSTAVNTILSGDLFSFAKSGSGICVHYSFNGEANRTLSVLNAAGQVVAEYQLTNSRGTLPLSNQLAKGVYICKVYENSTLIRTQKFIQ